MTDKKLIELIAKTWLENDGDSEGFVWNWSKVLEEIRVQEARETAADERDNDYVQEHCN